MRIDVGTHDVHLTYCLNIHPGEALADNVAAIQRSACRVRDLRDCADSFGLGLRLSATSAAQLLQPGALAAFSDMLSAENLYAFTMNGFPYGTFHATQVKDRVYAPDWTRPERLHYTLQLAQIMGTLLPAGVPGSISTSPGLTEPSNSSQMPLTKL